MRFRIRADKGDAGQVSTTVTRTITVGANVSAGPKGERGPIGPQGPQGDKGDKGDQGLTGEDGQSLNYTGPWESTTTYQELDLVESGNNIYMATASSLNQEPPGADWELLIVEGPEGPQGPQGEQGIKGDQGDIGPEGPQGSTGPSGLDITWRGTYAGATAYVLNDAVEYEGSSYIATQSTTGNLPTNATFWNLMAEKGETGATGPAGSGSGDMLASTYDPANGAKQVAFNDELPDVSNFETTTELNARDIANRNTDNHTNGTTNKVFTATEQTKLDGIESNATADQTDAEIKTAYENNANTNAFTDAEQTKLTGIESGAQVNEGPAGTDKQLQFNDNGSFGGVPGVEYTEGFNGNGIKFTSPDTSNELVVIAQNSSSLLSVPGNQIGFWVDNFNAGLTFSSSSGLTISNKPAYIDGLLTLGNNVAPSIASHSVSSGSWTPSSNRGVSIINSLNQNVTINAASSGQEGQKFMIRIKDNGTSRTLTWNAIYRPIGVTLPTATTANKTMYIGCMYNSADETWDVIAVSEEA